MTRPEFPFDATNSHIYDGDWLVGREGYIFALMGGWWLTSYQVKLMRMKDGEIVVRDPSTLIKIEKADLDLTWNRKVIGSLYLQVYDAVVRPRKRREIAEHRRQVQESWDRVQKGENV